MTSVISAENSASFSLCEVCERCAVEEQTIIELVEFGVVEPCEPEADTWCFSIAAYLRIRRALRLQRDLGINSPGIALALDLLDEMQQLREDLALFQRQ